MARLKTGAMTLRAALMLSFAVPMGAFGQAIPAASADPISTGFQLPSVAGSMRYSVGAVESLSSGYYQGSGWDSATGVNGNLAVITSSKRAPFSMIFSGGYFWSTSEEPTNSYANVGLSQVLNTKNWSFILNDSVSYSPSTPSVGLGGVPGTGDLGVPPVQLGIDDIQALLTQYSTRVSNSASVNVSRRLTGRLSLQGSGSYSMLRFLGTPSVPSSLSSIYGTGLNSNSYSGSGGLNYNMNARDSVSASYSYSSSSYEDNYPGFTSQTAMAGFSHKFSARLSGNLFAGPEWTSTQQTTGPNLAVVPGSPMVTSVNAYVLGALNYAMERSAYTVGYSRSTNSGFGVTVGGRTDSIRATATTTRARYWNLAANAAYSRTVSLGNVAVQNFSPKTFVVSGQVSRALLRSLSAYASYTLEKQSGVGTGTIFDVFVGSIQVVGMGITYSPPAIRFGPH